MGADIDKRKYSQDYSRNVIHDYISLWISSAIDIVDRILAVDIYYIWFISIHIVGLAFRGKICLSDVRNIINIVSGI